MHFSITFSGALASALLAAAPVAAEPSTSTGAVPLREVIARALRANPALDEARARLRAAETRPSQAAAWENPEVGVETELVSENEGSRFGAYKLMAGQQLPVSGRNRVMARMASADAAAEAHRVREMELETAAKTATAYHAMAAADALLDITAASRVLLVETERTARTRYESGQGALADLLAIQTEIAELDRMRIEIEQERATADAELGALLGLAATEPSPRPEPLRFRALASVESLEQMALRHRPALAAARSGIEAARGRETLSARLRIPDPMLELGLKDFPDEEMQEWTATVRFEIPWANPGKLRAVAAEARALREAEEHRLVGAEQETRAMVRDRAARASALARQWKITREQVVPLARKTVESVRAGYETGSAGFAELNMARARLQEAEETSVRLLARYLDTAAMLDAATGGAAAAAPTPPPDPPPPRPRTAKPLKSHPSHPASNP